MSQQQQQNKNQESPSLQASVTSPSPQPAAIASSRPQRKAKTKEAVMKHLNRDVELLEETMKAEKKPSTKKQNVVGQAQQQQAPAGKRSASTKQGSSTSASKQNPQFNVPTTIVQKSGSSNESQMQASAPSQFVSSLIQSKAEIIESSKNAMKQVQPIAVNKNGSTNPSGKSSMTKKNTRSSAAKAKVFEEPVPEDDTESENFDDEESELDQDGVDEDEDDQDEEDDDDLEDDEDGMDEEEEDEDQSESRSALALDKSKRKGAQERRQAIIANRALRIKMGKSGAQAASRRSIKKGKDACQRKLWNQDEDDAIVKLVAEYGTKRWTFIAQQLTDAYKIGGRTGKQCRERWHNHLDPNIKKSPINDEEERTIFDAHKIYGNKWADIAKLLRGRSDNCIKNYYYSTLRKHIRRINKSLKQCQVAKKLNLKVKNLTADILFPCVKDGKISYSQVKCIDPKKFEDLEHTMRMIFNHEDGQQVTQRGIIAAAQNRLKVEKQLEEMRERERKEEQMIERRAKKAEERSGKQHQKQLEILSSDFSVVTDDKQAQKEEKNSADVTQKKKSTKKVETKKALGKRSQQVQQKKDQAQKKRRKQSVDEESQDDKGSDEEMSNADDSSEDDHQSNPNQKITQKKEQDHQFSIKKATQNQTSVSQKKNLGDAHHLNPFSTSLTPFIENDKDLKSKGPTKQQSGLQLQEQSSAMMLKTMAASKYDDQDMLIDEASNNAQGWRGKESKTPKNNQDSEKAQKSKNSAEKKRDKKRKKKKKDKRRDDDSQRSRDKRYRNKQYPGSMFQSLADDAQMHGHFQDYGDIAGRAQPHNLMEILQLTSQRGSASKFYPPFYDSHMHKSKFKDAQPQDIRAQSSATSGAGPHGCFPGGQPGMVGGTQMNSSGFPHGYPGMPSYYNPYYMYGGYGPNYMGMMYHPQGNFPQSSGAHQNSKKQGLSQSTKHPSFGPDAANLKLFKNNISTTTINPTQAQQLNQQQQSKSSKSTAQKEKNSKDGDRAETDPKQQEDQSGGETKKEKSKNQKPEFMSHMAAMYPHPMHMFYSGKGGHPIPFGMPPGQLQGMPYPPIYPFPGMPLHGAQPGAMHPSFGHPTRERTGDQQAGQHHRSRSAMQSSYQNQFVLPITPNNMKNQQLFGEKSMFAAFAGNTSEGGRPNQGLGQRTRLDSNQTSQNNLLAATSKRAEDIGSQSHENGKTSKDKAEKKYLSVHKRPSSTKNALSQSQQAQVPQFNNNFTLMINHFGPPITQQQLPGTDKKNKDVSSISKKEKTERDKLELKDKIRSQLSSLSASKQISANKKNLAAQQNAAKSGESFGPAANTKQSFRPMGIGQLKELKDFGNKFKEALNSKNVTQTPSNGYGGLQMQGPLISASNLLLAGQQQQAMFGTSQNTQNTNMFSNLIANGNARKEGNLAESGGPQTRLNLHQQTPRLYFSNQKAPTSTTPGGAAAKLHAAQNEMANHQHQGQGFTPSRIFNLNSGNTFGSKLNTKTNAQARAALANKSSNLVTPKAQNIADDPETHRKLIEKMFEADQGAQKQPHRSNIGHIGGAFTNKQSQGTNPGLSNQGSNSHRKTLSDHKDSKGTLEKKNLDFEEVTPESGDSFKPHVQQLPKKSNSKDVTTTQEPYGNGCKLPKGAVTYPDRDSLGLFYPNPQQIGINLNSQGLHLNQEPLSSIYTGAPEKAVTDVNGTGSPDVGQTPQLGQSPSMSDKQANKPEQASDAHRAKVITLFNQGTLPKTGGEEPMTSVFNPIVDLMSSSHHSSQRKHQRQDPNHQMQYIKKTNKDKVDTILDESD